MSWITRWLYGEDWMQSDRYIRLVLFLSGSGSESRVRQESWPRGNDIKCPLIFLLCICLRTRYTLRWISEQIVSRVFFSSTRLYCFVRFALTKKCRGKKGLRIWEKFLSYPRARCFSFFLVCSLKRSPFFVSLPEKMISFSSFSQKISRHEKLILGERKKYG